MLHKQTADSKHTSSKTGAHLMQVRVTLPCGPGDDCECRLKVALLYSPRHWQGAGRQPLAARWRWWCWPTCSSWCVLRCSALYVPLLLRGTRQSVGTCAVWHPLVVCAAALSSATLFQPRPPADTACAALPPLLLPSPPLSSAIPGRYHAEQRTYAPTRPDRGCQRHSHANFSHREQQAARAPTPALLQCSAPQWSSTPRLQPKASIHHLRMSAEELAAHTHHLPAALPPPLCVTHNAITQGRDASAGSDRALPVRHATAP